MAVSTLNLSSSLFLMRQSEQKWLSNHLCTSYSISGPQQLKPAWMLWCQPCGAYSSLDSTLDKTTGWIKSLPRCPTGQNWQPCGSVPTILTRSLTAFLPETKWNTCGYHYCNFHKSYSEGFPNHHGPPDCVGFLSTLWSGMEQQVTLKRIVILLIRLGIFRFSLF